MKDALGIALGIIGVIGLTLFAWRMYSGTAPGTPLF